MYSTETDVPVRAMKPVNETTQVDPKNRAAPRGVSEQCGAISMRAGGVIGVRRLGEEC